FQILQQELESHVDLVSFDAQTFCLLNIPPWVKWQNYLLFLEQGFDKFFGDKEGVDFTDHVLSYLKMIQAELGLQIDSSSLCVYSAQDREFWQRLKKQLKKNLLLDYESLIEDEESFYVPELQWGFLTRASVNHASELAMNYLYLQNCQCQQSLLK